MKLFLQILTNIVYCTLLPLSTVMFTVMTMPLCFPEGYGTTDYLLHFCVGCLPTWLFVAIGYFDGKLEIISMPSMRKLLRGQAFTVVIIGGIALFFASMTKVSKINMLIVFLITLCCLIPQIVMFVFRRIRRN